MSEENKIRLVALIEEVEDKSLKKEYKIVNFLPNIKVEKIIEDDVHLQDNKNKYYFKIVKKDMFQIPYTKEFKDLTVLVGENGAGKTMMLNKIFKFGDRGFTYLIFEKNKEILIYKDNSLDNIALFHSNDYTHCFKSLNTEKHLNIIKFSNAIELYDIGYYTRSYKVDASSFGAITSRSDSVSMINKENKGLWEIEDQIIFVNEFKDKIREFVDYTKKGITAHFEGERLPFRSGQLDYINDVNNDFINERLVAFYSILINYMIDIDYANPEPQKCEHLLDFHLSTVKSPLKLKNSSKSEKQSKISLQYQSIGVDKDRFLPNEYSIGGLRYDVPNIELGDNNSNFWIKVWHSIYIINLYFEYIRFNKGENNKYKSSIEGVIEKLKLLIDRYKILSLSAEINDKLSEYIENINISYKKIDNNDFATWEDFWETIKSPCIRVAKAISYTSYFELSGHGYFVKHKLIPQRVMDRLREFGVHDDEINHLKEIRELLSKLDEINMNFKVLTLLIENISKLENIKLSQFLEMKWRGLSSGELALLKTFSRLYSAKKALDRKKSVVENKENYLLLLDEVDLGLHPRWQRKWISTALPIIEKIFEDNHLQIIITTHSPIFLSDIFEENIIYLPEESGTHNCRTFGQNIYSLFKNAFFLNEDEFIGEYAYQKIQDTIEYLRFKIDGKLENLTGGSIYYRIKEEDGKKIAKKIIDSIGEKIISNQLYELFDKAFPPVDTEIKDIENQIKKLENRLRELRGGEN
ncbi:AAA family ATPase [Gemella sp.]